MAIHYDSMAVEPRQPIGRQMAFDVARRHVYVIAGTKVCDSRFIDVDRSMRRTRENLSWHLRGTGGVAKFRLCCVLQRLRADTTHVVVNVGWYPLYRARSSASRIARCSRHQWATAIKSTRSHMLRGHNEACVVDDKSRGFFFFFFWRGRDDLTGVT